MRLIGLVLILSLIAPLAAEPQTARKVYRIGLLEVVPAGQNAANLAAFRQGLRELAYVEGQNLVIEYRSADGRAVVSILVICSRCPRCGKLFHGFYWGNPLRRRCRYCELPITGLTVDER
jgi:hypothetical protein